MKYLPLFAIALLAACAASAENKEAMTGYTVLSESGPAEIRAYAPVIEAEVTVEASSLADAASAGFRPLANYIFGGNSPRKKIAMTSPVMAAPKGQKIAMTAPVTAAQAGPAGQYEVRFIMPPEWTMETLPAPNNPDIHLVEVPGRTLASLRYTGRNSERARAEADAALRVFVAEKGYEPTGPAEWAGYDSPFVPFWMRRYEVLLPVRSTVQAASRD